MAINSRSKGAKNERKIAALFSTWTKRKFAKTPASGGLNWKSSFSKGDIVCTVEGHYFPFCIEAKFYDKIDFSHLLTPGIKNCDILKFWEQCSRDAKICKKVPLLFMRYNGLPADFYFVVMDVLFYAYMQEHFKPEVTLVFEREKFGLVIIRSNDFFNTKYKKIKLDAKTYIKTQSGR